ncbi:MAG TPA: SPOR domain-containing protein [Oligoflexia bacterium]|nr:SPOR domain-containing protein [Oligoflexia bacterium]HMP47159.1 SPOR domain-containing protein [Oligoflexia bacterium]
MARNTKQKSRSVRSEMVSGFVSGDSLESDLTDYSFSDSDEIKRGIGRDVNFKNKSNSDKRTSSGRSGLLSSGVTTSSGGGLSFKQIALFWSVTIVMMLVVFVSGYRAGKEEGAREVLDQAGQHLVRLPIPRPVASFKNDDEQKDSTALIPSVEGGVAAVNGLTAGAPSPVKSASEQNRIDFTKSESLPLQEGTAIDRATDSRLSDIKVRDDKRLSSQKVEPPKVEEVYPGRNLFPPPGSKKTSERDAASIDLPIKVDPPIQVEKNPENLVSNVTIPPPAAGWYLQVFASSTKDEATNVAKRIQSQNMSSRMEEAPINNKKYYRILVGPFADRGEAIKMRSSAKSASGVNTEPFIRQVK